MLSNLPMFTKPLYNRFKKRILDGLFEYNNELELSNFEELSMFLDMPIGNYMGICLKKMQKEGYICYQHLENEAFWIGLNPFWNAKDTGEDKKCLDKMYKHNLHILDC